MASMARDCTESRFREQLEQFGGLQNVLLLGELWDRAQSRVLLEGFLQTIFPGVKEEGVRGCKVCEGQTTHCKGTQQQSPQCNDQGPKLQRKSPQPIPDRALRFPLVFFLCRSESLRLQKSQRQVREILKDVRGRTRCGAAVIGVIVSPKIPGTTGDNEGLGSKETKCDYPTIATEDVDALLSMLRSVFPPGSRSAWWWEVRAAALILGQDETRIDVQRAACEALAAADIRSQGSELVFQCFPCIRRKKKNHSVKGHLEEGTALTVVKHSNGDCTENDTDA